MNVTLMVEIVLSVRTFTVDNDADIDEVSLMNYNLLLPTVNSTWYFSSLL